MRILILGAGGAHRTETSLVRAARELGHEAHLLDALRLRRVARGLAGRIISWRAARFEPDLILCTRHAASAGERALRRILGRTPSAFWYFDALAPLPPRVVTLGQLVDRVFVVCGFQVRAFRAAGADEVLVLPQAVDPETAPPALSVPEEFRCGLSFIGSGQFPRRYPILSTFQSAGSLQIRGPGWEQAPRELPVVGGRIRGDLFAKVVRGAGISLGIDALPLNPGEDAGGTSDRLWRVLGATGVFLGEYVPGIERLVTDGVHCRWYRTPEEGVAIARELLGDAAARDRLGQAGRAHVVARHTYAHRLTLLLSGQGYTST